MKKMIFSLLFTSLTSLSLLAQTITVDNEDPGFSIVEGNWTPSTFVSGFLGNDYVNTGDATTFSEVQWQLDTTAGDEYIVSARWTAFGNRTSSAIYTITHANGISTVNVDQRTNGGEFFSLGTFVNPTLVQLTNEGIDGFVVADAIRAEKIIPEGSFEGILHTNLGDNLQINTVYRASRDSIITYRNGPDCSGTIDLIDIATDKDFNFGIGVTRAEGRSGMAAPVKAGMYWRISRFRSGTNCSNVLIGLFPLNNSNIVEQESEPETDPFEGVLHTDLGDDLQVNTVYKADTDGIITYRNGPSCSGLIDLIDIGINPQFTQEAVSTTRAEGRDGMISPVKAGMYWRIRRFRNGSDCGNVDIGFFPIN